METHKNPWQTREAWQQAEAELPTEVAELVQAVIGAVGEMADPQKIAPDVNDLSEIFQGWTALTGWTSILTGEHDKALKVFESAGLTTMDPFSLRTAVSVAKHLAKAGSGEFLEDEARFSSENVWQSVFQPLLQ